MPLKFIKTKPVKVNGLRKHLHRQLAGTHPGRPLTRVHASDVTYAAYQFCPRERAYQHLLKKKPRDQRISTSEHMTFGIGHYVEDEVIETFVEAGMAVGDWKCKHCGSMYVFCKRPPVCKDCGHKHFEHIEKRVTSELSDISCGLDLLLALPGQSKHTVVEIKSIDKDVFKELKAPLAEHEQRTKLYLRCLDESSQPWTNLVRKDQAFVLYVSKGGYGTACEEVPLWEFWDQAFSPFKDFPILRDDKSIDCVVGPALEYKAWKELFAEIGEEAPLPPRICNSSLDKRAKKCSCLNPCFVKPGGLDA